MYMYVIYYYNFTIFNYRLTGVTEVEEKFEEQKREPMPPPGIEDSSQSSDSGPTSGPEVVPRLTHGARVVRGPDWKWGDQVS